MTVIAIKGIPVRWSLKGVVKKFAKVVGSQFAAMNFSNTPINGTKTVYLRLFGKVDAERVVQRINTADIALLKNFKAFIPTGKVPIVVSKKPAIVTMKLLRRMNPRGNFLGLSPKQVLLHTHYELLLELQHKYTALYVLSQYNKHMLLEELARVIFGRLHTISKTHPEAMKTGFNLSSTYRKIHPHFADFQCILTTLHQIEDKNGIPRTQISEAEMCTLNPVSCTVDKVPYEELLKSSCRYSEKIYKMIAAHISLLQPGGSINETPTPEDLAKKKVRTELKKLMPYLPSLVRDILMAQLPLKKLAECRVRIYGEPYLPPKEVMNELLKKYYVLGHGVKRSDRLFNCIKFMIAPQHFAKLAIMDGTVLNGSKLIIRPVDVPIWKLPSHLEQEIAQSHGIQHTAEKTSVMEEEDYGQGPEAEEDEDDCMEEQ